MERLLAAALFAASVSPICHNEQAALEAAIVRAERAEFQVKLLRKCITFIVMNPHGHCVMHST